MAATVHVCITCKDDDPAVRAAGQGGGAALFLALQQALSGTALAVAAQPCLGGCRGGGRVVLANPEKWGWLIEGIDTPADRAALLAFATAWAASPSGRVAKADRPTWNRARLLGRFPPALPGDLS